MKWTAFTLIGLLSLGTAHAQEVVFDSTAGAQLQSLGAENAQEFADDASFASAGRTLSKIDISVIAQSFTGGTITADVTASLYDNSGAGGSPGALLWSDTVNGFSFTDLLNVVSFSGVNTVVPQDVYWSVRFDNLVKGGFDIFGPQIAVASNLQPAGASTDNTRYYFKDVGAPSFQQRSVIGADSSFAVVMEAQVVPEPSGALLLAFGGAIVLLRLRARK